MIGIILKLIVVIAKHFKAKRNRHCILIKLVRMSKIIYHVGVQSTASNFE